jgi:hypothetical protein
MYLSYEESFLSILFLVPTMVSRLGFLPAPSEVAFAFVRRSMLLVASRDTASYAIDGLSSWQGQSALFRGICLSVQIRQKKTYLPKP